MGGFLPDESEPINVVCLNKGELFINCGGGWGVLGRWWRVGGGGVLKDGPGIN